MSARERAFRDAVRDILREDGVVKLLSDDDPTVVWEWDGARWVRARLAATRARRS